MLPDRIRRLAHSVVLRVFRVLPPPVRRGLVRAGTPSYTVGAVCVIEHEGTVLALRQPHRPGWSLPGGLLERGEGPGEGVEREVAEETGLRVQVGVPLTAKVNARVHRVDVVYRVVVARLPSVRPGGEAREARWMSPEEMRTDADEPTREILDLLADVLDPDARTGHVGRVVDESADRSR